MGIFRAVLISGPPGIGKTTSAHLVAKQVGYNPLELNASDARSKKLIEVGHSLHHVRMSGLICRTRPTSTTRHSMAFSLAKGSKCVQNTMRGALADGRAPRPPEAYA